MQSGGSEQLGEPALGGGEGLESGSHYIVGKGKVKVPKCAGGPRVQPRFQPARMSRDDHGQAVVLVFVGLGVLVHEEQAAVVKQGAIPFRYGLQARQEIGEFLDVPPADVAQDALPVRPVGSRRLAVAMRVAAVGG